MAWLCTDWCYVCDDYCAVLRTVAAESTSCVVDLQWHWIDIEDEADLVGEVDVETFPTLVIADGAGARFAGPLTPQPGTLRRLLRATVLKARDPTKWPAAASDVQAFAARLRSRPERAV